MNTDGRAIYYGKATLTAQTSDELYRRGDEAYEREEAAREKAEAKASQRAVAINTLLNVAEGDDEMAAVEAARTLLEIS